LTEPVVGVEALDAPGLELTLVLEFFLERTTPTETPTAIRTRRRQAKPKVLQIKPVNGMC
jgi:hypothetical protein